MGIQTAFLIFALVCAQPPVIQVGTLDEELSVSGQSQDIYLSSFILGDNVTYGVTSNYTTIEGVVLPSIPKPTLAQRMSFQSAISKPKTGVSNAKIGFQQDPLNPSLYFVANSNRLTAWDLNLCQFINDTVFTSPITAFFPFATGNLTTIVTVSFTAPNVSFAVSTYNSSNGFNQSGVVQSLNFGSGFSGAYFNLSAGTVYCYLWGSDNTGEGVLNLYSWVSQSPFKMTPIISLTADKLLIKAFSPVSFLNVPNTAIVCDRMEGVLAFNLKRWLSSKPSISLLWRSKDPVSYGAVLSCVTDQSKVYIATETSQLVYQIDETPLGSVTFTLLYWFPSDSNESIGAVFGLNAYKKSTTLALLVETPGPGNAVTVSFRVLRNYDSGFMLLDEWVCGLIQEECGQTPTPAFTVIERDRYTFSVVFDAYSSLYIYTVSVDAVLTINPGLSTSYILEGVVTAVNTKDGTNATTFPLRVVAWDPDLPAIYTTRNKVQGQGFDAPLNITTDLNSQDAITTSVYIPLSNYFSGQGIEYIVSLTDEGENLSVETPPIYQLNSTYYFPSLSSTVMSRLEFNGYTVSAVLSDNTIYLFDCYTNFTLFWKVSPFQSGFHITQFTCVIQLFSEVSMLVVESYTGNGQGGYDYAWDLFDISDPKQVKYVNSRYFSSEEMCGKLEGRDTYLYSLRRGTIIVATLQANNGNFALNEVVPISAYTLHIPEFNPVAFSTEVKVDTIYVYDAKLGLMAISPTSTGQTYTYVRNSIPVSAEPILVSLLSHTGSIFVLDPSHPTQLLSVYSSSDFSLTCVYSNFRNLTYISMQISYNYLALLCAAGDSHELLIFDTSIYKLRNLIAVLPVTIGCNYNIFYTWSGVYMIDVYTGTVVERWRLGQYAPIWHPKSALISSVVSSEYTVWAKVTFSFAYLTKHSFDNATVQITARSCISGETNSTSVSVWVVNRGTYLTKNLISTSSSPLVTGGTVNVSDTALTLPIPGSYFEGADATFAFVLNDVQSRPLLPQETCTQQSAMVCTTPKQVENMNYSWADSDLILDFDSTADYIYLSTYDYVMREPLNGGQNATYDITFIRDVYLTSCYLITVVDGAEDLLVIAGEEFYNSYSGQFLMLLNTSNPEKYLDIKLSFTIDAVMAVYDPAIDSLKIFAIDLTRVLVYAISNSSFVLYSMISSRSLNLQRLNPYSVEYINDQYILLGDQYTGLLALQHTSETAVSGQYTIYQTVPELLIFNFSGFVALRQMNESVFVLSDSTALYQYSLWGDDGKLNLTLMTMVFPVAEDLDRSVFLDVLDVDESGNFLVFPVFDGWSCRVRVVNMSASPQSRIFTSTDEFCSNMDFVSSGNVKIISKSDTEMLLLVAQAFPLGDSIFQAFTISFQTQVTIFPHPIGASMNSLVTLQLIALNLFSRASAPPFTVNFTT